MADLVRFKIGEVDSIVVEVEESEVERGLARAFSDIPSSMYWAIVTMTTVGYGDIVPQTALGKTFASAIMILGYGLIAVPTGIVSVEIANATRLSTSTRTCSSCSREGHDLDALYCRFCGERL